MTAPIEFHPAQSAIVSDTHRFRVVCAGRRFGKSTLAAWEMLGCAVQAPDKRIAYIAPTVQQARDIVWAELKRICEPIIVDTNETRLEIKVRTTQGGTSTLVLKGWEAIETLRGQKFHLLVLDEVASMRNFWEGWQEVLRPALTDYRGQVLFISTPKGLNHFYDLYRMEAKDSDYKSFHFTSYDNIHLPKDEIDKAKIELPEDRFAQEYMADFRKTEGLVYKDFIREKHVIGPSQLPAHFSEVIAGVDFGFRHPAAVLSIGKDYDGRYFVFKEWVHSGKTDADIADYVAGEKFQRVFPDPENQGGIEELRRRHVNLRDVKKGKGSVVGGINVVRELFKNNRLFISSDCVNLILGLETYSYGDDDKENPLKENDDEVDACFIAGTLIITETGEKPIETLVVGERVLTRNGFKKIKAVFSNGQKEIWKLNSLTGTANHPVWKEGEGFVPLASLSYGDMIGVCTPIITEEKQEKFGKPNMEKFLRDLISTIKTEIRAITILKISNVFLLWITKDSTGNKNNLLRRNVFAVLKNLKQSNSTESFAQITANHKAEEIVESTLKIKNVKNVTKFSQQTSIGTVNFAQKTAMPENTSEKFTQQNAESAKKTFKPKVVQTWHFHVAPVARTPTIVGKEEVFNLSVEDEEEYFAERVLVHNCRYPLMMDAQSSTRRTAEITLGNQKHYGADEYAPIIMEEGYTPHRYEV